MKKVKKGRVQLCQPVTDIGPQQPRAPRPTERTQGVHQDAALSSSPDCEPPSPARGKNIHWAEVPAWFLKTICLCFLFPFFFIKSSSQPNLFYAIRCWLSSRATYSVCLPDVPHVQPLLLRSCHLGRGLGCLISVCLELSIKREAVSEADDGSGPQKATYGPGCLLPQEQSRFQQALLGLKYQGSAGFHWWDEYLPSVLKQTRNVFSTVCVSTKPFQEKQNTDFYFLIEHVIPYS